MVTGATFLMAESLSTSMQAMCMHGVPYAKAIGCTLWPVMVLWPDAAFAMLILAQFVQNPGPAHWEVLKCVIVYLGSTKDLWLTFSRWLKVYAEGFCNADWGGQKHCHLISSYLFHIGAGDISWSLKKQYVIVLLSTKAEYIHCANGCGEGGTMAVQLPSATSHITQWATYNQLQQPSCNCLCQGQQVPLDWLQSGSRTFQTWSEPDLELGFRDQVQQNTWTRTS